MLKVDMKFSVSEVAHSLETDRELVKKWAYFLTSIRFENDAELPFHLLVRAALGRIARCNYENQRLNLRFS
jgi:hypothetical protein